MYYYKGPFNYYVTLPGGVGRVWHFVTGGSAERYVTPKIFYMYNYHIIICIIVYVYLYIIIFYSYMYYYKGPFNYYVTLRGSAECDTCDRGGRPSVT